MDAWTSIVLAAGKGTRMKSSRPKVLHPVAGDPLVAHAVRAASAAGPAGVIVVTPPAARDGVEASLGGGVECVDQPVPLGTGHALATALITLPASAKHVLVLNADVPLVRPETVRDLIALHERRKAALTLLSCIVPAASMQEVGRLQRGARRKPIGITEFADGPAPRASVVEVNVGLYAFDVAWLRAAVGQLTPHESGEIRITDLVARAVADGRRVEACVTDDPDEALSVNTREDLSRVEAAAQTRLRKDAMARGVTLIDPPTTYLEAAAEFEPDVTIHPNTAVRGRSRIASGSVLGPNAQVSDSRVGPGCRINEAVVEGARLGRGVNVGPYSHIRPGSFLEDDAYVGSHAEIKASRIGTGAHVGHFSYVGDADVGAGANIGAGVVTCNYDGAAKHITEIGDYAFIGSDSLLIAPVKVGDHAATAAGAVVNRDVPPGERVAGVPARPMRAAARRAVAASEGGASLG